MKIDVITVISPGTKKGYVNQSITATKVAADHSTAVGKIITSDGVPNNIGLAFKNGLKTSTAEYVCWVDDDDLVLPNAFACLERHLASQPAAIFAREIHLYANGHLAFADPKRRHHLTIYRRDVVDRMPLQDYPKFTTQSKIQFVEKNFGHDLIDEYSWVYLYRKYNSAGFYVRQNTNIPSDIT